MGSRATWGYVSLPLPAGLLRCGLGPSALARRHPNDAGYQAMGDAIDLSLIVKS
jgi:hypothetical protein